MIPQVGVRLSITLFGQADCIKNRETWIYREFDEEVVLCFEE